MKSKVAILASGAGTTAEAFIRAAAAGGVTVDVVLVICNKKDAGIFDRIKQLNDELGLSIETKLINNKLYPLASGEIKIPGGQSASEEQAILDSLSAADIDLVLSLGYLRKIGSKLVHEYGWRTDYASPYQARMLNTHPGLLPGTEGLWGVHIQEYVLERKEPQAGQTLHVVAEDYDEGPIVAEHHLAVGPAETADELFARVQAMEKRYLPEDVDKFIQAQAKYLQKEA